MKNILLFGAGKSATVLIDYLKKISIQNNYDVTVVDANLLTAQQKVGNHQFVKAKSINIEDTDSRKLLISNADIVISLMPPTLHILIAKDCLQLGKNLLTASYIDEEIKELSQQIKDKGLLFLYEMGLDPGIDHMSAMQIIDKIKNNGGKISSFISHCGGLVAPESDDNPWHYKISWNPRNVVNAGKSGATFLLNNKQEFLDYTKLFNAENIVEIEKDNYLAFYPNRDSISYIDTYKLNGIETFIRTTLRYPNFCLGWKIIVDLKLTSEELVYDTDGMSLQQFFKTHLHKNNLENFIEDLLLSKLNNSNNLLDNLMQIMEVEEEAIAQGEELEKSIMTVNENGSLETIYSDEIKEKAANIVAYDLQQTNTILKQLFYLGINDEKTLLNLGKASAADVLQFILESKLALKPTDKDMIVMLHEFEYSADNKNYILKSLLKLIGDSNTNTAMAKTVGLPLGIAADLILKNEITETGLHIPTSKNIYNKVLFELKNEGIVFEEKLIQKS